MSILFRTIKPPPELHGYVDFVDPCRVIGWAAHRGGVAPELTVSINGRKVGQVIPNIERPDLSPLFPNNIRLGFNFRLRVPLTHDAKISVVDQYGRDLSRSPYHFSVPKTEWLKDCKRAGLALHYLKGSGIEIGALHEPLTVPAGVLVKYVDRLSRADLFKHYPELNSHDVVDPDIISDGETLNGVESKSVDFVIANHFIEHTQDPIATLKTFVRVLRPDGVIFMAVPDKRWSFDKDRELTPFSHLQKDHEEGPQGSRDQHFIEWVRDVEKAPEVEFTKRVDELQKIDYSIHFHVWDALSFVGFLAEAKRRYNIPIQLCAVVAGQDELIVVLRNDI